MSERATPGSEPPDPRGANQLETRHLPLLLGVDAGGSRTRALVADAKGAVLGRGLAGRANYQSAGFSAATVAISAAIMDACREAGAERETVRVAVMGLAGVARPEDQALYRAWAAEFLPSATVRIANDAELALAAGTPEGWGLALICGTGSIAVGRAPNGQAVRAGGWGPILGDEGSGYALGRSALRAVMRAYDGRGPDTALTLGVLAAWELPEPEALVRRVYREGIGPAEIAGLAPIVEQAAATGDEVARAIVRAAGAELALALQTIADRLELSGSIPCALAGGVLVEGKMVRAALLDSAIQSGPALEPVNLVSEPVMGAVRLAVELQQNISSK